MPVADEKQQKSLIQLIISDPSTFSRIKSILKPEYFDKNFRQQ